MNTHRFTALILLLLIVACFKSASMVYGQSSASQVIDARVKISICGNGEIEGGEDCEGSLLQNKGCMALGYSGGQLTCDIACSYDTSLCSAVPVAQPTDEPSKESTTNSTVPLVEPTVEIQTRTELLESVPQSALPEALKIFDIRGVGKILTQDLPIVVRLWVEEWKKTTLAQLAGQTAEDTSSEEDLKKCDINTDNECNLYDFSLLMFYVNR